MIEELQECIPEFAGSASHTHCFLHIVNLIAKSLLRQFDAQKMTVEGDHELAELRRELADEKAAFQGGMVGGDDNEAVEEVDNDDGLVDEMDNLTDKEKEDLERSIRLVKLVLVKVRLLDLYTPLNLTIGAAP